VTSYTCWTWLSDRKQVGIGKSSIKNIQVVLLGFRLRYNFEDLCLSIKTVVVSFLRFRKSREHVVAPLRILAISVVNSHVKLVVTRDINLQKEVLVPHYA